MPSVRPFIGLLYDPAVAGPLETVTAPPYDVISPGDQEQLYGASPFNLVRLILAREEADDDASGNRYSRAAAHVREWRARGVLVPTEGLGVYPYEMEFQLEGRRRRVRGVIVEAELEPWGGSIVPHERTLPGPIEDRLALLQTVQANLSPVYAVSVPEGHRANRRELSDFLEEETALPPLREVVDESGTRHRLWASAEGAALVARAMRDQRLMIADGHHRYAVALIYREAMRAVAGAGPWDAIMMLVVDAAEEDPPVLPIHRALVRGKAPAAEAGARVRDLAEILATLHDEDLRYGTVSEENRQLVHRIARLEGEPPTVCALHEQLLDRAPGLELRYLPDAAAVERLVVEGEASAAYLLPPSTVERVWRVVRAGRMLPQKSTYFWPKPRTGLVIRPLTL